MTFQYLGETTNTPLPTFNNLACVNRSNSISDESLSSEMSSTPCTSPCSMSNDDTHLSTSSTNPDFHVLYVNLNGEYVPIAKTSFMIQTSLSPSTTTTATDSKPSTQIQRKKNFICTYPNCTKAYFKSSHLKAHIRLHTGKQKNNNKFLLWVKKYIGVRCTSINDSYWMKYVSIDFSFFLFSFL